MPKRDRSHEQDEELLENLEQVNRQLQSLDQSGGDSVDPERLFADLEERTIAICESLEDVMHEPESTRTNVAGGLSLNSIINEACREMVMDSARPIVVRSRLDPATPKLSLGSKLAYEVIATAFRVVTENVQSSADQAAEEAELFVSTRSEDHRATLELCLEQLNMAGGTETPSWPRLQQLAEQVGGSLGFEHQPGQLTLILELPAQVPTAQ